MEQLIVVVWDSCQHWSKSPKDVDLPVSNKLAEMKMWYLAANIIIKNDPKLTKITIFFANLTELLLKSDLSFLTLVEIDQFCYVMKTKHKKKKTPHFLWVFALN